MAITIEKQKNLNYLWGDEVSNSIISKCSNRNYSRFKQMNLMLSAWSFLSNKRKFEKLQKIGIRKFLELSPSDDRLIYMDSGGFKGYTKNLIIKPKDVLDIYDIARLKIDDKVISLDYAPLPHESPAIRIKKVKNSIKNFNIMKPLQSDLLPVIHGWSKKEMKISLDQFQNEPMISFPSYFTLLTNNKRDSENNIIKHIPHNTFQNPEVKTFLNNNFSSGLQKITTQKLIVKRFIDFINFYKKHKLTGRVHILGMSAGLAMQIMAYTGIFEQWDSANWRVKANHYKIMFAYPEISVAEAYIGKKIISYGSTKWKSGFDRLLMRCDCPICTGLSLRERKSELSQGKSAGFNARAIHNAYHYHNELTLAKEKVGTDDYIHYIDKRVKKSSPFYKMLWRCIRKNSLRNQPTLDAFLRKV